MESTAWLVRHHDTLAPAQGNPVQTIARGAGAWVWAEDGSQYLDLLGGGGSSILGHAHPEFTSALTEQSQTLGSVGPDFTCATLVRAAEATLRIAEPGGLPAGSRVLFTNSASETIEAALKVCRLWHGPQRNRILVMENAQHQTSSWAANALNANAQLRQAFSPYPWEVEFLPYTNLAALGRALEGPRAKNVAAVILEPIQVCGGVRELSDAYLGLARETTTQAGALLIIDETSTTMGQTGQWLAHHQSQIIPDLLLLGKGLAGGLPAGALICTDREMSQVLTGQLHRSTLAGNPFCMAAILATINTIEKENLLASAARVGRQIHNQITSLQHPLLSSVRGRGLVLGIGMNAPVAGELSAALFKAGYLTWASDPFTLVITPPLVLSGEQARLFVSALALSLEQVAG